MKTKTLYHGFHLRIITVIILPYYLILFIITYYCVIQLCNYGKLHILTKDAYIYNIYTQFLNLYMNINKFFT